MRRRDFLASAAALIPAKALGANVLASCGSVTLPAGTQSQWNVDTRGIVCSSGGGAPSSVWSAADATANSMPLSNGGLTLSPGTGGGYKTARGAISRTTGKFYIEFLATSPPLATQIAWGIADASFNPVGYLGESGSSAGSFNQNAGTFATAGFTSTYGMGAPTIVANDVMAIAVDLTGGKYWMALNNVWFGGGSPSAGTSPMVSIAAPAYGLAYFPAMTLGGSPSSGVWTLQPIAVSQKYASPAGFLSWG